MPTNAERAAAITLSARLQPAPTADLMPVEEPS